MPKKTRKAKMRAAQRPIKVGYPVMPPGGNEPIRETLVMRPASPSSAPIKSSATAIFDYRYVFRDLRRIGLLAGTFFVLMFVIWFLVEVRGIHIIPGLL